MTGLPARSLAGLLAWCKSQPDPFDAFNTVILRRGPYWQAQRLITQALLDPAVRTIAVPAGHSVGKSFLAAGALLAWLCLNRDSVVVSTAPSQTQLANVLWKEVRKAWGDCLLAPYGRITANPEILRIRPGWYALGQVSTRQENLQGHHSAGPLLVIVDEASGVEDPGIWATLTSLKPRKRLLFSNPLRPEGPFYEACQQGESDPGTRVIRIPSTASPDIGIEQSGRGLADAGWLRQMAAEYGVGSLVWNVRVLARFPEQGAEAVIPAAWLDAAGRMIHQKGGPTRMGVDLGGGNGGDKTVLVVRDDNGILFREASNRWSLEAAATRCKLAAERFGVAPSRITYDRSGLGLDFANRLAQVGLHGCKGAMGGMESGDARFSNLRTACAWALRQRLDPERTVSRAGGVLQQKQVPFAIPREILAVLRPELLGLRYHMTGTNQVALEDAESFAKRLKHSPDDAAALLLTWAYPNA